MFGNPDLCPVTYGSNGLQKRQGPSARQYLGENVAGCCSEGSEEEEECTDGEEEDRQVFCVDSEAPPFQSVMFLNPPI